MFNQVPIEGKRNTIIGFLGVSADLPDTEVLKSIQRAYGEIVLQDLTTGMDDIRRISVELRPMQDDINVAIIRADAGHDSMLIINMLLLNMIKSGEAELVLSAPHPTTHHQPSFEFTTYNAPLVERFKNVVRDIIVADLTDGLNELCVSPKFTRSDTNAVSADVQVHLDRINELFERTSLLDEKGDIHESEARALYAELTAVYRKAINLNVVYDTKGALDTLDDKLKQFESI